MTPYEWHQFFERKQQRKTEYQRYLESPEWKALREKILNIRGRECEECGLTEQLNVHHKSYKAWGDLSGEGRGLQVKVENPENFLILCKDCHEGLHNSC